MRLDYFTATWCVPCKIFGPIMDSVANEFELEYNKIVIDQNENPNIPTDVLGVPTVIMYIDDKEVSRIVGARGQDDLRGWIASGGI